MKLEFKLIFIVILYPCICKSSENASGNEVSANANELLIMQEPRWVINNGF